MMAPRVFGLEGFEVPFALVAVMIALTISPLEYPKLEMKVDMSIEGH